MMGHKASEGPGPRLERRAAPRGDRSRSGTDAIGAASVRAGTVGPLPHGSVGTIPAGLIQEVQSESSSCGRGTRTIPVRDPTRLARMAILRVRFAGVGGAFA